MDKNGNIIGQSLKWANATATLDNQCDVVHIMNCCDAAEGAGEAEYLAASARNEPATQSHAKSFTAALTAELRRLSSAPLTIAMLHSELMGNRRAHHLDSIPFYRKRADKASITLPFKGRKGKARPPTLGPNSSRVLITAHVDERTTQDTAKAIKKWLTELLPRLVIGMEIKLEGVWESDSTILLLSLPVCIWTQLTHDMAYMFVGEANSSNQLLQQTIAGPPLALRPESRPSGSENEKPGGSPEKEPAP
ncbi:Zinc finger C2H2 [Pyrenophora seminiperda CCB06]|uniref:Zinc finger C2H2 n=1 Tax=Pyrenophora seminiperda CCB06 TaxID=1302712 RepID=A0A3M7M748_9PLEO|nr:Zinc finger C2H2 [Pyrenophora seminiperda CCB06]